MGNTPKSKESELVQRDRKVLWHPYSSVAQEMPLFAVKSASGVEIELEDGRRLIDGMSSWWSAMHGYNHPELNAAVQAQLKDFAHVMFGGLTHEPAVRLAETLVELTPDGLDKVFLCDSGSVSVEVAMKMAVQYWHARGKPEKSRFLSLRRGYHGDTWGAMSVCDPDRGMHQLFSGMLAKQLFIDPPECLLGQEWDPQSLQSLEDTLRASSDEIAALILEPVVQGTGGMRFYHPNWLANARAICDKFDVLLIADEIATGFGRTGKLFGCEWAAISPDIMCLGKTLSGGYLTLAATLCSDHVAQTICSGEPGLFMHGPTYMGNALACAVANASIDLLMKSDWHSQVSRLEEGLVRELQPAKSHPMVEDVRVLGAIGVVELREPVDMKRTQPALVERGVWVRPFGTLIYLMPPYVMSDEQLTRLCRGVLAALQDVYPA